MLRCRPPQRDTARALLALAGLARDRLDLAGRPTDEAHGALLDVVARWCDGVASDAEVRAARKIAGAAVFVGSDPAARDLAAVARDLAACVGGGPGVHRGRSARGVVDGVTRCLRRLGEAPDLARELVVTVFAVVRRGSTARPTDTA